MIKADAPEERKEDRALAASETVLVYQEACGGSWSVGRSVYSNVTPWSCHYCRGSEPLQTLFEQRLWCVQRLQCWYFCCQTSSEL